MFVYLIYNSWWWLFGIIVILTRAIISSKDIEKLYVPLDRGEDMFSSTSVIIEQIKMKKQLFDKLNFMLVFLLWVAGYTSIKFFEKNNSEANLFFAFGLAFAIVSCITAIFITNDRDKTLSFYKIGMIGYALYTILFEILMYSANIGGDQSVTQKLLQTMCGYSRAVIPLGMVLYQAKKWTFITGLNKNKLDASKYIRRNGNNSIF